jgi:hypothetical protein
VNLAELKAHDDTAPAPGRLDVVLRFLNLHDHVPGASGDLRPSAEMVREYLVERGLLDPGAGYPSQSHERVMELFDALHDRLAPGDGSPSRPVPGIEDVARRASFRLRFDGEPSLEPAAEGAEGAIARLLAIVFLAELDGSWSHMKRCASPTCHSVFFDRSKNQSGKWCSMKACGNQHKVRAWRERHRQHALDA